MYFCFYFDKKMNNYSTIQIHIYKQIQTNTNTHTNTHTNTIYYIHEFNY